MDTSHERSATGKDEWITPRFITDSLGPFDLDPCAPMVPPWRIATETFTIKSNGLTRAWKGFVWCNPPYGTETAKWVARLADHGHGIALIFARTDTKLFHTEIAPKASGILFIKGRLSFHHVDGSKGGTAGAASMLVAYGETADYRLRNSGIAGIYVNSFWPIADAALSGEQC